MYDANAVLNRGPCGLMAQRGGLSVCGAHCTAESGPQLWLYLVTLSKASLSSPSGRLAGQRRIAVSAGGTGSSELQLAGLPA